jgi:hypothetical protein
MRYSIEGKPVEGVPTRDVNNLSVAREKPEVEAVLIAADEALRRGKRSLSIRYGVVAAVIAIVPPPMIAADPRDWMIIAAAILAIWIFFAWYMPFMYRRKLKQFASRMAAATLPAAPGTAVRADQTGLTIGDRSWPWPQIAIDSIGLTRQSTGGDQPTNYTLLQNLGLTAGGEQIQLDGNTLSTGNAVLDQIYRRLKPAE